ncbi:serine/threonine-protein kinase [Ruminococcus flavefaciens]|uniref:serine/threonine-protein kinase n=1 Tax=Ruminococcus flavefaciens TaxID=1265 RepID=UPI0013DACACD|nr:serine/threonine-protein kinase [Ruminococcus flavefaciens]
MIFNKNAKIYKYILLDYIGGGNFGEVWRAADLSLNTECALKLIPPNRTSVDERLLEAKIGNRLNHVNVVNIKYADVVEYEHISSLVAIAMPYYEKGSVVNMVNSCNFLQTDLAIKCLIDVLRGLEYLHENNYYHCDIKPNNILVGDNNEFILTDYGITCFSPNHEAIKPKQIYLTHVSPETLKDDIYDIRTDIYQVGLTAFRLFNGISEISDKFQSDPNKFKENVSNGMLITDSDYQLYVPRKIRRIINKAIEADPNKRYQTALAMRRDLEQLSIKGYCTSNSNGEKVFISGNKEYRYEVKEIDKNLYDLYVYQKNIKSGRETKASKFCKAKIRKADVKKQIMQLANNLI